MGARNRSRGNDGHVMQRETVLPRLRVGLINAILGQPEPLVRRAPATYHGPKRPGGSPAVKHSDDLIRHIRWLGLSMPLAGVAEVVGLDRKEVRLILAYRNRAHLDPAPHPEAVVAPVAQGA